jgi:hypothetical protein
MLATPYIREFQLDHRHRRITCPRSLEKSMGESYSNGAMLVTYEHRDDSTSGQFMQ